VTLPAFGCDTKRDGKRCDQPAAWVYLSGVGPVRQLVCDECKAEYARSRSTTPIVEFALVELLPARADLLADLKRARDNAQHYAQIVLKRQMQAEAMRDWRWRLFGWKGRMRMIDQEVGFPERD
jgi:hypothetical protein